MIRCAQCILTDVAKAFGVTVPQMVGREYHWRNRDAANARKAAYLLLKKERAMSLQGIGNMLGRRHHTTVLAGLVSIKADLQSDDALAAKYARAAQ